MVKIDCRMQDGERVIYRGRLHPKVVIIPIIISCLIAVWMSLSKSPGLLMLLGTILILSLIFVLWGVLRLIRSKFIVTNLRLIMRSMWIGTTVEIPLKDIKLILFEQNPLGRLSDYGSLTIFVKDKGMIVSLSGIPRPRVFLDAVGRGITCVSESQTRVGEPIPVLPISFSLDRKKITKGLWSLAGGLASLILTAFTAEGGFFRFVFGSACFLGTLAGLSKIGDGIICKRGQAPCPWCGTVHSNFSKGIGIHKCLVCNRYFKQELHYLRANLLDAKLD